MEVNSPILNDIKTQIKESYGRVVYTYTTHLKEARILSRRNTRIKWSLIILSAISTCGLLAVILNWNRTVLAIISVIFTTTNLALSTYSKSDNLEERIISHINTSNFLWKIREDYACLLTDFDSLSLEQIKQERNKLSKRCESVYSSAELTSKKAYNQAQAALRSEEEQFFEDDELEKILPKQLRK